MNEHDLSQLKALQATHPRLFSRVGNSMWLRLTRIPAEPGVPSRVRPGCERFGPHEDWDLYLQCNDEEDSYDLVLLHFPSRSLRVQRFMGNREIVVGELPTGDALREVVSAVAFPMADEILSSPKGTT